jgi:ATP-dependent Clp protease adaptor protein ClpS
MYPEDETFGLGGRSQWVWKQARSSRLSKHSDQQSEHGFAVEEARPEVLPPKLYKVYLVNDDFTPMEFVVEILQRYFGLTKEKATQIMMQVHYRGRGMCGVYTYEIAESKVTLVNDHAREHQHPLMCSMEEV